MRGEGNHKIPGSFAPKNMKKTGAERVKCSLACQHEDAIPIKFVSYVQKCPTVLCTFAVALRKESVDRNPYLLWQFGRAFVALRKESVDRNFRLVYVLERSVRSLSARRAWIEISKIIMLVLGLEKVALRKESVDRNVAACPFSCCGASLSARRAWIEMVKSSYQLQP